MIDFKITKDERRTNPLWRRLVEHWKARRDTLRAQNDGDIDPIKTARLRGQIAELSRLIEMDVDQPVVEPVVIEKF